MNKPNIFLMQIIPPFFEACLSLEKGTLKFQIRGKCC